jgi:hypothetical protein
MMLKEFFLRACGLCRQDMSVVTDNVCFLLKRCIACKLCRSSMPTGLLISLGELASGRKHMYMGQGKEREVGGRRRAERRESGEVGG